MENIEVANIFEEVADLLDIQGGSPFRVRAYRTAARTIGTLGTPVEDLLRSGPAALEELPGIGADLAGKIEVICKTGALPLVHQLSRKTPESLVALLRIPGLGPKRVKIVYDELGVKTIAQLEKAARSGRLATLHGFGPKTAEAVLHGIQQQRAHGSRTLLVDAEAYVRPLVEALESAPGVARIEIAGSYRRRAETVGDVDILVASSRPTPIADRFLHHPSVGRVLAQGTTRCSVVLTSGLQVDLRIVRPVSFGAALHYFTGSKPHNIAVRAMGVKRGLKINEYGVFRGARRIGGRTEAEVYKAVGLTWMAPELRENRGELEASRDGTLPDLVELDDLRGDLQMHTTYTDGQNTVAEMVEACAARGYEYMAITDHTKAVRVAGGLTGAGFRKQFREIDAAQKRAGRLRILKSAEVDILDDGSLDLDDRTLAELDLVVVSVHSRLTMSRTAMTRRVIRALRRPRVHILAHPTGRLIGRREPVALDMGEVLKAARDHGVMLEINAQPDRLDLNDVHAAMAREAGVKLVISTDAHRAQELARIRFGVDQARRGWCRARDIANTLHRDAFLKLLRR